MNRLRGLPLAPAEGWLTVGLVVLSVMIFAWSVDNAAWVLREGELTDFLSGAAFLSVVYGFLAAKAGWSRWPAHALGACFAALVVPLLVGGALLPEAGSWREAYEATASSTVQAYIDLAWRGRTVTAQFGHFMLLLGLIVWATGQFAGYATFAHRRPLSAMTLIGLLLLANMSLTAQDHLWYLVAFSLAALLLLVRLHAFDEQSAWLRRRIGDPAAVAGIYLRGGTAFVAATVIAALLLTGTAKSAPLQGAWGGMDQRLIEVGQHFQGLLQSWGGTRISGVNFGPNSDIGGIWDQLPTPALQIQLAPGERSRPYWRVYTYDIFTGRGWQLSQTTNVPREAGAPLVDGALDEPAELGTRAFSFSVTPLAYGDDELVSPMTLVEAGVKTIVRSVGADGFFGTVERAEGEGGYTGVARIPVPGEEPGELNEGALRGAGTEYPDEVLERYLQKPEGELGPESKKMLAEILAAAPAQNAYDIADTMEERFFHDEQRFIYDSNILDIDCAGRNAIECFAWSRRGYCMQFASTMTMLLREANIPARLAMGFLPGDRDPTTGVEILKFDDSHAWVEVYFPGYGWVQFDPTAGISQLGALPAGIDPSPRPSGSRPDPGATDDVLPSRPEFIDEESPGGVPTARSTQGPLIAVTILLAITIGALGFVAYRRGPRGSQPDTVYGSIVRIASRLGFAPRPNQTVYEYTGALGDVLPMARPELSTVARAKVEVAYGRQILGDDRLRGLLDAQRRLRVQLLRLLLRRRELRRRRR